MFGLGEKEVDDVFRGDIGGMAETREKGVS